MTTTTTRLSDVIQIPVYDSYIAVNNPETSLLVRTGIIATSPDMNALATGTAIAMTIPYWNDLDPNVEPNYSNDDPDDIATANKVTSASQNVRKSFLNQIYGSMDLTRELAGSDPMRQIKNRFGEYWVRQLQRRVISSALGVMNDNVANDSGDMTTNIALETTVGQTGANLFSRDAFVNAAFTMGDQTDSLKAIAMHSVVYKRLIKNDDIDFIPDSQGTLTATYLGSSIIVDDSMPVIAGTTSGFKYVSVLFGRQSILFGEGSALVPSWVYRNEKAGNGGGMEEIGERKEWVVHPNGFSWVEGSLTEFSPTLADLKLAAHWDRKVPRKFARMAFLITNG